MNIYVNYNHVTWAISCLQLSTTDLLIENHQISALMTFGEGPPPVTVRFRSLKASNASFAILLSLHDARNVLSPHEMPFIAVIYAHSTSLTFDRWHYTYKLNTKSAAMVLGIRSRVYSAILLRAPEYLRISMNAVRCSFCKDIIWTSINPMSWIRNIVLTERRWEAMIYLCPQFKCNLGYGRIIASYLLKNMTVLHAQIAANSWGPFYNMV